MLWLWVVWGRGGGLNFSVGFDAVPLRICLVDSFLHANLRSFDGGGVRLKGCLGTMFRHWLDWLVGQKYY
jgi:hypothetical protein